MHLKYTFETMKLDNQVIAVPVGNGTEQFRGVIKLNETGAFIFELLRTEIDKDGIIKALENQFDAPRNVLEEDLEKYVEEFAEKGLLVE